MMPAVNIATDRFRLVLGLGKTGWSVVRYLGRRNLPFAVADTRHNPPYADRLRQELPETLCVFGKVDEGLLRRADEIVLSPGISHEEEFVKKAKSLGKPIVSDVALFRAAVTKPLLAISGSNGKSTVTSLLAAMAARQGIKALTGGNIGTPVLDLIQDDAEAYIVELSSFQLEITHQLAAAVACLINVTPDHQDRYANLTDYYQAKQKIFEKSEAAVYNKTDKLTAPLFGPARGSTAVGLGPPDKDELGILPKKGVTYIAMGVRLLMPVDKIKLAGKHNLINVMMALGVAQKAGWELEECLQAAQEFEGLAHRCEWVARKGGVDYINDSKATNPPASCAALEAFGDQYARIHVILGGQTKGADFGSLKTCIKKYGAVPYLIGEEAQRLHATLGSAMGHGKMCQDLEDAVRQAKAAAAARELVLLAPACASLDSYDDFGARGNHFKSIVRSL